MHASAVRRSASQSIHPFHSYHNNHSQSWSNISWFTKLDNIHKWFWFIYDFSPLMHFNSAERNWKYGTKKKKNTFQQSQSVINWNGEHYIAMCKMQIILLIPCAVCVCVCVFHSWCAARKCFSTIQPLIHMVMGNVRLNCQNKIVVLQFACNLCAGVDCERHTHTYWSVVKEQLHVLHLTV